MRPVRAASLRSVAVCAAVALSLASCGTAIVSPSPAPTASRLVPSPTPAPVQPSPSPSPSTAATLDIASLPEAALDPSTMTVLCDPTPGQTNMDAGESLIGCTDGPVLALRAIRTGTPVPVTRLYLRRATCPTGPCTPDQLDTAVILGWTSDGWLSVALDGRLATVTVPRPVSVAEAAWPDPGVPAVAPVQRPVIPGAPKEVATRTPYPFCGREDLAGVPDPAAALCFVDAVLAGRPAEYTEQVYDTEGGPILWLYRFSGQGAPVRYEEEAGAWSRNAGSLILSPPPPPPVGVEFEQWPETRVVVH